MAPEYVQRSQYFYLCQWQNDLYLYLNQCYFSDIDTKLIGHTAY